MSIRVQDITVVVQGDIRPTTEAAIRSVRHVLPTARIVLSTFDTENLGDLGRIADEVVLSPDPGAMAPFVMADEAAPNNTNRQLTSTQAGLNKVTTGYAIKMRTDCHLHGRGFIRLLSQLSAFDGNSGRLVVSSFYTRHPRGLACYLFHISDWFVFGTTDRVKKFFSAPLMSLDVATWFERNERLKNGTYAARRFRARFTPEQYITNHFAQALGYRTPRFLNDVNDHLRCEYERFLAKEVVVASPRQLEFSVEKYRRIDDSLYQKIDCLGLRDWCRIFSRVTGRNPAPHIDIRNRGIIPIPAVRLVAHKFRHAVIKIMLGRSGPRRPPGGGAGRRGP